MVPSAAKPFTAKTEGQLEVDMRALVVLEKGIKEMDAQPEAE